MAEIDYNNLKRPLEETVAAKPSPVYLIHGEEMLVKEAFQAVLKTLLPEGTQSLNCELFDGADGGIDQVIERLNTYSLMPGNKVVALTDARLFSSGQDKTRWLKKAREAAEAEDFKAGGRHLAAALGIAGLTWDDLDGEGRRQGAKLLGLDEEDAAWLDGLITYARERAIKIVQAAGDEAMVQSALEKGIPTGNYLLVTTEQVDRRKRLYTAFRETGTVIDCSVPKGERRADRQAQEALLRKRSAAILEKAGKRIDADALTGLVEMVGFDMRTFSASLEKLVDYTGSRSRINAEDVSAVLKRSKKDPIFEFTNAVTDRDLDGALFYVDSLLTGGVLEHPLQLLGALVNQLRKLILLKGFVESEAGGLWQPSMTFSSFKSRVLPALQQYDTRLIEDLERWQRGPAPEQQGPGSGKKGGAKKKSVKTDLRTVANPKNAYPVFMLMQKAERFSRSELVAGLKQAAEADRRIKTGGGTPRTILEHTVLAVCR